MLPQFHVAGRLLGFWQHTYWIYLASQQGSYQYGRVELGRLMQVI
jgi:hypothetical protein